MNQQQLNLNPTTKPNAVKIHCPHCGYKGPAQYLHPHHHRCPCGAGINK